jgi:hypothetical protein
MISPQGQPSTPDPLDLQNRLLSQLVERYLTWTGLTVEQAIGSGSQLEVLAGKDPEIAQRLGEMRETFAGWADQVNGTLLREDAIRSFLAVGILNRDALRAIIFRIQKQKYKADLLGFFRALVSDGLLDFYLAAKKEAGEVTSDEDFRQLLSERVLPRMKDVLLCFGPRSYIPFRDMGGMLDFVQQLLRHVDFDVAFPDWAEADRKETRFAFEQVRGVLLDYMKKERLGELVEHTLDVRAQLSEGMDEVGDGDDDFLAAMEREFGDELGRQVDSFGLGLDAWKEEGDKSGDDDLGLDDEEAA